MGGIILNTQVKANGMWSYSEKEKHINFKELKAAFLCLQTFARDENQKHIRIESDNTVTVSYINNMGGKVVYLDDLARKMWFWALERNIWLSSAYIPGVNNQIADHESRKVANDNTEWQLKTTVFKKIQKMWPFPKIDLFASRLNNQLPRYVSWGPDPKAVAIDAMSLYWSENDYYLFPPFSLLGRVLAKLDRDGGSSTLVAPVWPTQNWWVKLLAMVIAPPKLLGGKLLLTLPWEKTLEHPLRNSLHMAVFRVSGNNSLKKGYQKGLPHWRRAPGEKGPENSIGRISRNGVSFVLKGKVIQIAQL